MKLHEHETVENQRDGRMFTTRLAVPLGWLYRHYNGSGVEGFMMMEFVADPDAEHVREAAVRRQRRLGCEVSRSNDQDPRAITDEEIGAAVRESLKNGAFFTLTERSRNVWMISCLESVLYATEQIAALQCKENG